MAVVANLDILHEWRNELASPKRGLPAISYVDEGIYQRECETVFRRGWVFAGFVHSFNKPGDVHPVSIGGYPILLVKGKSGEIGAFHNVCRHRCLKLIETPTNVGTLIKCPYHAWAYGLDGRLRSSPYFGGVDSHAPVGFDPAEQGLMSVRTHVWHDWIFVNLDGYAEPFDSYAKPLTKRLDDMDLSALVPVATLDFGEISTNWKFIMENFIEPYHVQFVHATTTEQPLKDHATFTDGRCLGSIVDLPDSPGSDHSLAVSSRYLTLFPTFVLGRYFPDQLGVYLNIPLSAGRMLQKRVIYKTDGTAPDVKETEDLKTLWWNVHKEDHAVCERMQSGRASPVAEDGGVLSPCWEDGVRAFQELVVDEMTAPHGDHNV